MVILILGVLIMASGVFWLLENASVKSKQVQTNMQRVTKIVAIQSESESELQKSFRERLVMPLVLRASDFAMRISPAGKRIELARKVRAAGVEVSPQTLLGFKGVVTGLGVAVIVLGTVLSMMPVMMFGLVLFVVGWMGPDYWLNSKARARRDLMERALPDTLDLLTVSVEAGLGFDAAVSKVCEKMTGPLIDEFAIMAREIQIGESRREALRNMGERVDSDDVRAFTRAIIQADELGTSLGRTLKVQASDMRVHRQLAAEEKAMKAPVKMLFPTVMFIFPAMFISILGPAFLNIMEAFSNTGG